MTTQTLTMDNLIFAVLSIGSERVAAGNYDQAVSFLTTTVEAVEADQETRNAYNLFLLPVYALRALALLKCAQVGNGDAALIQAQQDVLKAQDILDEFGGDLTPEARENLRERVADVLIGDDAIVRAGMAALQGEKDGSTQAVTGRASRAAASSRPPFSCREPWYLYVCAFFLGAIGWAGAILIFTTGGAGEWIGAGLLYFMIYLTLEGCPWMSRYGPLTVGAMIKYILVCLLACTIIGLIPIGFWAGKKALSWAGLF